MSDKPIEIEFDNKEVHEKLLNLAKRTENLRPLMKNIAGIFSYSTEENFKEEGRPDKWVDLAESTKKQRTKKRKWPGLTGGKALNGLGGDKLTEPYQTQNAGLIDEQQSDSVR